MAKDDYFVVIYQILSYLYQQLKNGKDADPNMIQNDGKLMHINSKYWCFIMKSLINEEYIQGARYNTDIEGKPEIVFYDNFNITHKGIEYLTDNSFMEKAKRFLKDINEIVPFSIIGK